MRARTTDDNAAPRRRSTRIGAGIILIAILCCGGAGIGWLAYDKLLPPTDASTLQAELDARLDEIATTWRALDTLWGRLEAGESVLCSGQTIRNPYFIAWRSVDRAAHPNLAALADRINGAIRALHRAADLWTGVCQSSETGVAPEIAAAARSALESASEVLRPHLP